jgi:hypothetical protein
VYDERDRDEVFEMKKKASKRSVSRSKKSVARVKKAPAKKRARARKASPVKSKVTRSASAAATAKASVKTKTKKRGTLRRRKRIAARVLRRRDDADAFLRVRADGKRRTNDDFAKELAEDFVGSATSGEEQALAARDSVIEEESGGPFVTTPAKREFADGFDASNPEDAFREPFPSSQSQPET